MKKNGRRGIFCFFAFLTIIALDTCVDFPGGAPSARLLAQERVVDTGQRADKFRSETGGGAPEAVSNTAGLWKTVGVFLLGAGLSLLLLVARRRQRAALGAGGSARNSMQVLSRVVLSPRHTACLLKVGPAKLVVVALCGETMTPLCTIDGEEEISKFLEGDGASSLQDFAAGKIEIAGKRLDDSPGGSQSFFSVLRRALFPAPTGVER